MTDEQFKTILHIIGFLGIFNLICTWVCAAILERVIWNAARKDTK